MSTPSTYPLPPTSDPTNNNTAGARIRIRTTSANNKASHLAAGDVTTLFASDSPFFRLASPRTNNNNPPTHLHSTMTRPGESPQLHATPTFTSGFSPRIGSGTPVTASPARFRRFGPLAAGGGGVTKGLFGPPAPSHPILSSLEPASEIHPTLFPHNEEGAQTDSAVTRQHLQEELDSHLDTPSQAHHHPLSVRFKSSQPQSNPDLTKRLPSSKSSPHRNRGWRSLALATRTRQHGLLVQSGFDAVVLVLFWMSVVVFFSALCGVGGGSGGEGVMVVVGREGRERGGAGVRKGVEQWHAVGRDEDGSGYETEVVEQVGEDEWLEVMKDGEIILDGFDGGEEEEEAGMEVDEDTMKQELKVGGEEEARRGGKRTAAKAFFGRFGDGLGLGGPRNYGWEGARV